MLKPVEYGERKYPSMHALAEAYGLDVWGARYRLTLGLPMGALPDEMWANWWRIM